MRPAWRLAINSLSARASRTLLLVAAVALSAALIAAVSCAMASVSNAVRVRLEQTVGRCDLRIKGAGTGQPFAGSGLSQAQGWPETRVAAPRLETSTTWRFIRPIWTPDPPGTVGGAGYRREVVGLLATAVAHGIDPDLEPRIRHTALIAGRLPTATGAVALDQPLLERTSTLPADR